MWCNHIRISWILKEDILLFDIYLLLSSGKEWDWEWWAQSLLWRLRVSLSKAQRKGLPRVEALLQQSPASCTLVSVGKIENSSRQALIEHLLCSWLTNQIRALLPLICCITKYGAPYGFPEDYEVLWEKLSREIGARRCRRVARSSGEEEGALVRQKAGEYESWSIECCSPPYCLMSSLFPSSLPLLPCRSLGYTWQMKFRGTLASFRA